MVLLPAAVKIGLFRKSIFTSEDRGPRTEDRSRVEGRVWGVEGYFEHPGMKTEFQLGSSTREKPRPRVLGGGGEAQTHKLLKFWQFESWEV